MFQLIVAVIAIALVIALTLASLFYGGEAFTRGTLKANVAALVNQAQQISGASTLYKTDFSVTPPNGIADLVAQKYLANNPVAPKIVKIDATTEAPVAWQYDATAGYVSITLGTEAKETCEVVVNNGVGNCADVAHNPVASSAAVDNVSLFQFSL